MVATKTAERESSIMEEHQVPVAEENSDGSPLSSMGDTFQDPQGMPETTDNTAFYIYCFFLHVHTYDKV